MAAEEDHLDREVSGEVQVTPTGVGGKIKSRFIAALDRLGGEWIESKSIGIEIKNREKRMRLEARATLEKELLPIVRKHLEGNPEKALSILLGEAFDKQAAMAGVAEKLPEMIEVTRPAEVDPEVGESELSDEFMGRFERYAGTANSEELQARWARVLAAELWRPGTVSPRVMRVVDELDSSIAREFETICKFAASGAVYRAALGDMPLEKLFRLSESGLLADYGENVMKPGQNWTLENGSKWWAWDFGMYRVAVMDDDNLRRSEVLLRHFDGTIGTPIYTLTTAGASLASMVADETEKLAQIMIVKFAEASPRSVIAMFKATESDEWEAQKIVKPTPVDVS